jgi:peptide/nickel transport system permease protein
MSLSTDGPASAGAQLPAITRPAPITLWRRWLSPRKLWANRLGVFGGGVFLLFLLCGIFAPWIAPKDPNEVDLLARFSEPIFLNAQEGQGVLGTDFLGRDVFSRLIYGARIAAIVALTASALSGVIGITLGIATAYYGGFVDDIIMRFADTYDAIPGLILILALLAFIPGGVLTLILLLGIVGGGWIGTVRIVRGESLSLRGRDYVLAAEALGASDKRIMFRHILPNTLAPIIVGKTMGIGGVILAESGLSFLGLGVPPDVPSWGRMLSEAQEFILVAWWPSIFPGLVITFVVLSTVFLGDWLRDTLDPRLRGSR